MRLTRNTTTDGRCKYAIVRLDKLRKFPGSSIIAAQAVKALEELAGHGLLEYGEKGSEEECFVLKLKDQFTAWTLEAYVGRVRIAADIQSFNKSVHDSLSEYANEVLELADRSYSHPSRKIPD